jgi:hypothetical protein
MANKRLGFSGQWIDLFKTGRHVGFDEAGKKVAVEVTPDFLRAVADNYDPALHEAPACIGHPENDAPAYGWVDGMRVEGNMLQAQFADTDAGFEQIVNAGRYKKRSPKFYLDEQGCGKFPYLRHVAWLGAEPPAVKGMRDVQRHAQFSEDEGETVAFEIEFSEGEGMTTENKTTDAQVEGAVKKFLKETFPSLFGEEKAAPAASFSETDRQKLIADATTAATAAFSEELKARDTKIEALTKQVNAQTGSSQRGAIVAFCESLPGTVLPWMRNAGVVEFMEGLEDSTTLKKVPVLSFSEEGGKEVEKTVDVSPRSWFENFLKTLARHPAVSFGESFGDLKLQGDGGDVVNPKRMDSMRSTIGLPTSTEKTGKAKA